ncbi:MAG TPA: GNAT family N-acetyltransferase [Ktedonobacteraceae bacterium]|nr:GNAT family N-acetyltransferase [Ktedonobacteraceae bacterium]
MSYSQTYIRTLTGVDIPIIERLLRTSEYIYQRFTLAELPHLLNGDPAVGLFHGNVLDAFLLSQTVNPPSAWIGGFGVSWTESKEYVHMLSDLLERLCSLLLQRGVRNLYYSSNDVERDWLRPVLLLRGFMPYRSLYAYDKYDRAIPLQGNQEVIIRPVSLPQTPQDDPGDLPELLEIERLCFEDLWRYDRRAFADIVLTHPYFVVAELGGQVVGYQFNAVDDENGYLVRIAVHPSAQGQGIGARLMAEALRFFQRAHVLRIMLNTLNDNYEAHRLYERFGFVRIEQQGFVLRKPL